MTPAKMSDYETTGPSRRSLAVEICIIKLYYIFTFYYICAVVRATDTTCRITEMCTTGTQEV